MHACVEPTVFSAQILNLDIPEQCRVIHFLETDFTQAFSTYCALTMLHSGMVGFLRGHLASERGRPPLVATNNDQCPSFRLIEKHSNPGPL